MFEATRSRSKPGRAEQGETEAFLLVAASYVWSSGQHCKLDSSGELGAPQAVWCRLRLQRRSVRAAGSRDGVGSGHTQTSAPRPLLLPVRRAGRSAFIAQYALGAVRQCGSGRGLGLGPTSPYCPGRRQPLRPVRSNSIPVATSSPEHQATLSPDRQHRFRAETTPGLGAALRGTCAPAT